MYFLQHRFHFVCPAKFSNSAFLCRFFICCGLGVVVFFKFLHVFIQHLISGTTRSYFFLRPSSGVCFFISILDRVALGRILFVCHTASILYLLTLSGLNFKYFFIKPCCLFYVLFKLNLRQFFSNLDFGFGKQHGR